MKRTRVGLIFGKYWQMNISTS